MVVYAPMHDPFHRDFSIKCMRCNFVAGPAPIPGVIKTLVKHVEHDHPDIETLQIKLSGRKINGWPQEKLN